MSYFQNNKDLEKELSDSIYRYSYLKRMQAMDNFFNSSVILPILKSGSCSKS